MKNQFVVANATGQPLVHDLKSDNTPHSGYYKNLAAAGVIVILGVVSGFFLSGKYGHRMTGSTAGTSSADKVAVGSADSKTFKDTAEGKLEKGGINGEGTHHLVRPGGESQTVALTSSVLDLKQFEGKQVKVWGETFAGSSAGWFMDVGKVETVN